jgi:alkanesulfonate monooxygenase SsuD/methylene tetrahydromethanopterin reductase-like flavin-dependent oxidoreductase (luciferase family)
MSPLHLAVALDGAGWHPAAWREPSARPADLLTAGYWVDLARTAERGRLDLITFEDSFGLQSSDFRGPDGRNDHIRGRLDAVQIAARVAPATRHIGLVPTALVTTT